MGVLFALGLASLAVQALVAAQLFVISRAPGWGRARPFAWLALTAAMYTTVYTIGTSAQHSLDDQAVHLSVNLLLGALHGAAWVWFARAPEARRWSDLPRGASWHIGGAMGLVALVVVSGQAADTARVMTVNAPWPGLERERPLMSPLGLLATAITGSLYATSAYALWTRRHEKGMPFMLAGYAIFLFCVFGEIAIVTIGWELPYLAPFSFPAAILPVAFQFQHRFTHDAERLAWLSNSLQGQLASRTEERDAARDALLRQERVASIGRLASGLAHELSNPLQHVALSVDELQTNGLLSSGVEGRLLRDVAQGVDRMQEVVHRLHDLVDHGDLHMAGVQLADAVRQAVALTALQWKGAVTVQVEAERVPPVMANEGAVVRALVALLLNAVEALERAPLDAERRVTIATRITTEGLPSVEVRDSGPGFPADTIAHAGEPLFKSGDEVGLGLFAVHRIMRVHGGRVILGNVPSGGAMVALVFPAANDVRTDDTPAPHIANRAASPLASGALRGTILVVDDEPLVRNAFARVLERAGYRVLKAEHGHQALDLLRRDVVDLVVTDLMMPVMNGVELAGVLAASYPSLHRRLVVVCGGAVTQDAVQFLNSPGLRVLSKPIAPTELLGAVSEALADDVLSGRESPSTLQL